MLCYSYVSITCCNNKKKHVSSLKKKTKKNKNKIARYLPSPANVGLRELLLLLHEAIIETNNKTATNPAKKGTRNVKTMRVDAGDKVTPSGKPAK